MHWIIAVFNICDYTRFVTDMTSESFGLCELAPLLHFDCKLAAYMMHSRRRRRHLRPEGH